MLAPPLHPAWLDVIDALAPRVLGRGDRKGEPLIEEIRQVSLRYTRRAGELRADGSELAARMRFFLPRDLPKIGGPLAELAVAGALPSRPTWRVLDLGAGLGTSTLGVSAFARALGGVERLEVLAADRDSRALDCFAALSKEAGRGRLEAASVPVSLDVRALDLEAGLDALPGGTFDLVVLGLCLNELFTDAAPDAAIASRTELVRGLVSRLAPDGALVVLEPALSATARSLQAVRDVLVGASDVYIVAPCVDRAPCPLLVRGRDWCHEDLPLTLLAPLAELARGAGLRWEGASYAYLALTRGDRTLAGALRALRPARVVGGPIVEKGRREFHLCRGGERVRLNVLDRDELRAFDRVGRGTVLELDREPASKGPAMLRHGRDICASVLRTVRER